MYVLNLKGLSSMSLLFFHLDLLQNDAKDTSQSVQLRFRDRRVVVRKLVGVLPVLKKIEDEREKTKFYLQQQLQRQAAAPQ